MFAFILILLVCSTHIQSTAGTFNKGKNENKKLLLPKGRVERLRGFVLRFNKADSSLRRRSFKYPAFIHVTSKNLETLFNKNKFYKNRAWILNKTSTNKISPNRSIKSRLGHLNPVLSNGSIGAIKAHQGLNDFRANKVFFPTNIVNKNVLEHEKVSKYFNQLTSGAMRIQNKTISKQTKFNLSFVTDRSFIGSNDLNDGIIQIDSNQEESDPKIPHEFILHNIVTVDLHDDLHKKKAIEEEVADARKLDEDEKFLELKSKQQDELEEQQLLEEVKLREVHKKILEKKLQKLKLEQLEIKKKLLAQKQDLLLQQRKKMKTEKESKKVKKIKENLQKLKNEKKKKSFKTENSFLSLNKTMTTDNKNKQRLITRVDGKTHEKEDNFTKSVAQQSSKSQNPKDLFEPKNSCLDSSGSTEYCHFDNEEKEDQASITNKEGEINLSQNSTDLMKSEQVIETNIVLSGENYPATAKQESPAEVKLEMLNPTKFSTQDPTNANADDMNPTESKVKLKSYSSLEDQKDDDSKVKLKISNEKSNPEERQMIDLSNIVEVNAIKLNNSGLYYADSKPYNPKATEVKADYLDQTLKSKDDTNTSKSNQVSLNNFELQPGDTDKSSKEINSNFSSELNSTSYKSESNNLLKTKSDKVNEKGEKMERQKDIDLKAGKQNGPDEAKLDINSHDSVKSDMNFYSSSTESGEHRNEKSEPGVKNDYLDSIKHDVDELLLSSAKNEKQKPVKTLKKHGTAKTVGLYRNEYSPPLSTLLITEKPNSSEAKMNDIITSDFSADRLYKIIVIQENKNFSDNDGNDKTDYATISSNGPEDKLNATSPLDSKPRYSYLAESEDNGKWVENKEENNIKPKTEERNPAEITSEQKVPDIKNDGVTDSLKTISFDKKKIKTEKPSNPDSKTKNSPSKTKVEEINKEKQKNSLGVEFIRNEKNLASLPKKHPTKAMTASKNLKLNNSKYDALNPAANEQGKQSADKFTSEIKKISNLITGNVVIISPIGQFDAKSGNLNLSDVDVITLHAPKKEKENLSKIAFNIEHKNTKNKNFNDNNLNNSKSEYKAEDNENGKIQKISKIEVKTGEKNPLDVKQKWNKTNPTADKQRPNKSKENSFRPVDNISGNKNSIKTKQEAKIENARVGQIKGNDTIQEIKVDKLFAVDSTDEIKAGESMSKKISPTEAKYESKVSIDAKNDESMGEKIVSSNSKVDGKVATEPKTFDLNVKTINLTESNADGSTVETLSPIEYNQENRISTEAKTDGSTAKNLDTTKLKKESKIKPEGKSEKSKPDFFKEDLKPIKPPELVENEAIPPRLKIDGQTSTEVKHLNSGKENSSTLEKPNIVETKINKLKSAAKKPAPTNLTEEKTDKPSPTSKETDKQSITELYNLTFSNVKINTSKEQKSDNIKFSENQNDKNSNKQIDQSITKSKPDESLKVTNKKPIALNFEKIITKNQTKPNKVVVKLINNGEGFAPHPIKVKPGSLYSMGADPASPNLKLNKLGENKDINASNFEFVPSSLPKAESAVQSIFDTNANETESKVSPLTTTMFPMTSTQSNLKYMESATEKKLTTTPSPIHRPTKIPTKTTFKNTFTPPRQMCKTNGCSSNNNFCGSKNTGTYPNNFDCTKYWICVNGVTFPAQCQKGLIYNYKANQCTPFQAFEITDIYWATCENKRNTVNYQLSESFPPQHQKF